MQQELVLKITTARCDASLVTWSMDQNKGPVDRSREINNPALRELLRSK
jgi:hypothetical protein